MSAVGPLAIIKPASAGGFLWAYATFTQVMIDVGFAHLLRVAMGYYVLSALLRPRAGRA
jgi:hypothetical protein